MSAKREKEKRSLLKKLEEIGDQNQELYEIGYEWFDDEDYHEQWFSDACFILLSIPGIPKEMLYPASLPFFMEDAGLIKEDDIFEMLMEICPAKHHEILSKEAFNELKNQLIC